MHTNIQVSQKIRVLVIGLHSIRVTIPKVSYHSDSDSILKFDFLSEFDSFDKSPLSMVDFDACILIYNGPGSQDNMESIRFLLPGIPILGIIADNEYYLYEEYLKKNFDVLLTAKTCSESDIVEKIVNIINSRESLSKSMGKEQTPNFINMDTFNRVLRSQSLYKQIVESNPDLVCRSLPDTTLTFVNQTYCDFFQKSRDELIGIQFSRFLTEQDLKIVLSRYESLTPDNPKEEYEHRIISSNNEIHWFEWQDNGIFDEKGTLVEVQSAGRDITAQHIAQEQIRQQKKKLETLFNYIPHGIVFTSPEYIIQNVNKAFCQIFGFEKEELLGKELRKVLFEVIKTTSGKNQKKQIGQTVETIYEHESIRIGKNNVEVPVFITVFPFTNGGIPEGLCIIYKDLTEEKQKKEALRVSKTIIESSPVIVFSWKAQKGWPVEYVSDNVRLLGFTPEEMKSSGWFYSSIVHHEDIDRLSQDLDEDISEGRHFFEHEYRIVLKSREIRWVREKSTPEYDDKGKLIRYVGVITDDTERITAKRELQESHDLLKWNFMQSIICLAETAGRRDPYTALHQKKVAELSTAIALQLDLDADRCEGLFLAATVHDVGKISVPAEILAKPSSLNDMEMGIIKGHSQSGFDILKRLETPWPIAETIYQHHERIDGSGYPQSLKGDEILLEAKIIAVADIVEAVSSHRPYRPSLGIEKALKIIQSERDTKLDPDVVDACLKVFEEGFSFQD